MTSDILIHELHQMHQFRELLKLQQAIWHMAPADCISPPIMRAVTHNGGVIIGASHSGRMVGFCFAFTAKRGDSWLLWSFATGVHPDYQGQGIGYSLKQAQRTWAQEHGYDLIGWTFDPLQRGNANFNFNRLGIVVRSYHVDFYGEMKDGINIGLASDRFEASWDVADYRIAGRRKTIDQDQSAGTKSQSAVFLVQTQEHGDVVLSSDGPLEAETYAVEIPYDIGALKQHDLDRAIHWQLIFRETVQRALATDYIIVGFVVHQGRCWYVLRRPQED